MLKTEDFSSDLQLLARNARVLSHPARLSILQLLAEAKTCISGDISDYLPLSRSTVSQHLKELKEMGLICGEIDGIKVKYCLNPEAIAKLNQLFRIFFESVNTLDSEKCETNKTYYNEIP